MNPNKVFVNDSDIIEIQVIGDQTMESVQRMGDAAIVLARKQRAAGHRALVLDNLLQIGQVPPQARSLVMQLVQSSDYDKLAMLGSGSLLRLGANLILQATGRGKVVRYFEDRANAVAWLMA